MIETLQNCPLCGGADLKEDSTIKDFSVSKEVFTISRCQNCGFLFTNPRPDEQSIGRFYQSDQYVSHSNKSNSIINFIYKLVRNYTLKQKLQLIDSLSEKKRLLDFGCGTGHFLELCQKHHWYIDGLETDKVAKRIAEAKTNKKLFDQTGEIVGKHYDVITLWHVLEHVHRLQETMKILSSALSENGKMIVAVPNYKSYDSKHYQEHWAAYDVPRHLYHFEKKTMERLALRHGLKIVNILPMKFDAFYVSMLSEKYKGFSLKSINMIITSCKSNIYAKKTNEYSSLIYVLSK